VTTVKKTTIKDIARACDVSHATVSRVLMGADYPVSEKLRNRVRKAAEELRYTPNLIGRALKTQQSNDVGIIVTNISNPAFVEMLINIEQNLSERSMCSFIATLNRDPLKEKEILENFLSKQVRGIIFINTSSDQHTSSHHDILLKLCQSGVRIVVVDSLGGYTVPVSEVVIDYQKIGYIGTKHLLDIGRKRIAYLSAPLTKGSRLGMYKGYFETIYEFTDYFDPTYSFISDDETEFATDNYELYNGSRLAKRLLETRPDTDAIFCCNDMTAIGAMAELKKHNVRIPQDIAVIGCDNILMSRMSAPTLSSIQNSPEEIGRTAVSLLLSESEHASRRVFLNPSLVIRESTGG